MTDWLPLDDPLPVGKRINFAPVQGRSSKGGVPLLQRLHRRRRCNHGDRLDRSMARGRSSGMNRKCGSPPECRTSIWRSSRGETIRSSTPDCPTLLERRRHGPVNTTCSDVSCSPMIVPKADGKTVVPPIAPTEYRLLRDRRRDGANRPRSPPFPARGSASSIFWLDAYYGRDNFPTVGNYRLSADADVQYTAFSARSKTDCQRPLECEGLKFLLLV